MALTCSMIVADGEILQQVENLKYLGCDLFFDYEQDING